MTSNRRPGNLNNESIAIINFVSEKISESLHALDHDPSLALYQMQVHIHKTLPKIASRKYKTIKINEQLDGACFDIDNSKDTVNCILKTSPCLQRMKDKIKECLYFSQQLEYEHKRLGYSHNSDNNIPNDTLSTTTTTQR
uniref:BLOC-1-related complex subunit 8 n=1 Tax=Parastrongyloides trichosuri TaxID=131310 RepID=A0A0N4Z291_PARTI